MSKRLKGFPWLNIEAASELVASLIGEQFSVADLANHCLTGNCPVYLDTRSVQGQCAATVDGLTVGAQCYSHSLILFPHTLPMLGKLGNDHIAASSKATIYLEGLATRIPTESTRALRISVPREMENLMWHAELKDLADRNLIFKSSDIHALAATLNGDDSPAASDAQEIERLRKQFIEARKEVEVYELKIVELQRLGRAAERRAEQAEAEAEKLRQDMQLNDFLAHNNVPARESINEPQKCSPACALGAACGALVFPYATKELEVMQAVAIQYWASHSPDKRQPKQEEIQRAICSRLGLSAPTDKTPPNKAVYLATAIKPDNIPRA